MLQRKRLSPSVVSNCTVFDTNQAGKYMIHRPRPIDHVYNGNMLFPYPPANADGTYTGDIQQLEGSINPRNDSMWMDLDLPVKTWKGKNYKPLVAFLVVDLDGRINVNVAGNKKGPNYADASNQGWGPWEMNLSSVLPRNGTDWQTILNARYGSDTLPNRPFTDNLVNQDFVSGGPLAPSWSGVDVDGSTATSALVN